jgi:dienelactone hydrolase
MATRTGNSASVLKGFMSWCASAWQNTKPGPEERRGAYWAALLTVVWAAVIGGINLKSGFGLWADLLFTLLVAALGIPVVTLAVALLLTIFRRLPRLYSGFLIAAFVLVAQLWRAPVGYWASAVLLSVECTLGAAVATIVLGGFRRAAATKRVVTILVGLLALAGTIWVTRFFGSDGINETLLKIDKNLAPLPAILQAPNPAQPGPYPVKTLLYGHGDDRRRSEYGKTLLLRTGTLDASPFFKDFTGWKVHLRRAYWGFAMDKLPLNGRVWYPAGAGPFPLVLIVHGNHNMSEFSDPGYEYLGNLLASRGFILASLDENFLNVGLYNDPPKQQAVRGWMLLEHLKIWRQWNATPGNPFFNKIDLDNVALMGHSRGGEAVATAALFNKLAYDPDDATIQFHYGFPIKALVAIAPVDGQYKPAGQWRRLQDVNYFTIQGANDGDLSSFQGSRQWEHVRFSGNGKFFKSELYIYRANHGQFNTGWGRTDDSAPANWFLNLRPLLTGDEQRQIAKVYISAFLEATLHNRREYLPLFEDYRRGRNWLPNTLYVNRYSDDSSKLVSDFGEDADLTTTTVPGGHLSADNLTLWREAKIPFRSGDRDYNGVFLGWNREHAKTSKIPPAASYSVALPPGLAGQWQLNGDSALTLSIAVSDESAPPADKKLADKDVDVEGDDKIDPTDFTIVLETGDGVTVKRPVSQFNLLLPPLKVRFTKLERLDKLLYKEDSEPIFQSVIAPLSKFVEMDKRFDPAKLKTIRLVFDRTPARVVILSGIGFSRARSD